MNDWKKSFAEKLGRVRSRWATQMDQALENSVVPVFNGLAEFLRENGFRVAVPLRETGRRSFKFELAEDAYLLMVFEARGVGEFELTRESFVLGSDPKIQKSTERVANLDPEWTQQEFQSALDSFVEMLGGSQAPAQEELAVV